MAVPKKVASLRQSQRDVSPETATGTGDGSRASYLLDRGAAAFF